METKRITLNLTPEMQESFAKAGIKDLTSKCMAELLNGGLVELINQDKQLMTDMLNVIEQYHNKYSNVALSLPIFNKLNKLRQDRNVCRICGLKLAIERFKCADCLSKESTEITLNKLIEMGVNNANK
jgi:hypothetical protein